MREADGNKRLRWAFGLALLLHAAALGAASRLPAAVGSQNGGLEEIRVFGPVAPAFVSRVDLVEWPAAAPSGDAVEFATVDPAPIETGPTVPRIPEPAPTVRPPSRQPDRQPARPAPEPVVRTPEPVRPAPAVVSPAPVAPAPVPADGTGQAGDGIPPGGGGGGGGGSVDLGSRSPNGTIGVGGSGGTRPGRLPGQGTGSGPGRGPGRGGTTGGGSGGGTGTGQGTGVGEGSGSGTGGGEGDGGTGAAGSGSASRVADRREPEVLRKSTLEYPASAARDGVEGIVRLRVLVGEAGNVLDAEVIGSSGDRRLDRAAADSVRTWRYLPAVQDGKPRRVHTEAKVTFKLT